MDLLALVDDLGVEDLALALAADVLAGGHAEDPAECGGEAGHDDVVVVLGRARDEVHDGDRADQAVLRPEDRLADLAQQRRLAALVGEVGPEEVRVELARRHPRAGILVGQQLGRSLVHPGQPRSPASRHAYGSSPAARSTFARSQGRKTSAPTSSASANG